MATFDMYAYNLRNIARAGLGNSDDERLGIRQIKFWIQYYFLEALPIFTDFGKDIDPQLITDFGIFELTEVDKADAAECQGIDWGCTIMKFTLPKLANLPKNRALTFLGKIDKQTMFQRVEADVNYFIRESRYANLITRYWIVGRTVYIEFTDKDKEIAYVNARGILEDPSTFKKIVTAEDGSCEEVCFNDATDEFPMVGGMYAYIVKSVLMKELGMTLRTVEDLLNDAQALNPTKNEVQSNEQ